MLSILCLGVGKGATNFLTGEPSTAYVLKRDGNPVLLLDCGAGVARSLRSFVGDALPRHIYISHNHNDHTGDLPVYMAIQHGRTGQPITFFGHPNVLDFVARHRLHELSYADHPAMSIAEWNAPDETTPLSVAGLKLEVLETRHSYLCFGFLATDAVSGHPVFGWTADSAFDPTLYDRIATAPVAIVHGRAEHSADHASFDEIDAFAAKHPNTRFYVSHYGSSDHVFGSPNVCLLKTGTEVVLQE